MDILSYYYSFMSESPAIVALTAIAAIMIALIHTIKRHNAKKLQMKPNEVRQEGETSHFHIQTPNAQESAKFFSKFGLVQQSSPSAKNDSKYTVMTCPDPDKNPHLVLEEVPNSSAAQRTCSQIGIGRICIGVRNVFDVVDHLKTQYGLEPVHEPVCDYIGNQFNGGKGDSDPEIIICIYRDPTSGTILQLFSFKPNLFLRAITVVAELVNFIQFPFFVHANVNVSDFDRGMQAYQSLGYATPTKVLCDYKNSVFEALGVSGLIAKGITSVKTPSKPFFAMAVIQWGTEGEENDDSEHTLAPVSSMQGGRPHVRTAFTVKDLPNEVDRLCSSTEESDTKPLWTLVEPPRIVDYPAPLDKALVATIRHEDGVEVDVVEYVKTAVNFEVPSNPEDKIVLITGCDSGFGRTVACRMSLLGFHVVAACYSQEGADYLRNICTTTVVADLGANDGVSKVIQTTRKTLNSNNNKQLWALVNNAGVCYPANVDWQTPERYQETMQVNYQAPVALIHAFIHDLKATAGSRILQVSSVCGMVASPTNSAYCASKSALEAYSDSLRAELLAYDCHVCIVQPATMKTPIGQSYFDNWYKGFLQAPKERQGFCQMDQVEEYVSQNRKKMEEGAEDPNVTTTAMVQALVEPRPPSRLRTGLPAKIFYRPLSMIPDVTRDNLLWSMLNFKVVATKKPLSQQ